MKPMSNRFDLEPLRSRTASKTCFSLRATDFAQQRRILESAMFAFRFFIVKNAFLIWSLAFRLALPASAQDAPVYGRTRALEESRSQGERQAEQAVSLSAEKLIDLLQREPGLMLEVKKLLFRTAFEQGRILESRDLTDEALFRLLREDETIRVLATQEVTRRFYIRALPTAEERKRQAEADRDRIRATGSEGRNSGGGNQVGTNQEDRYWYDRGRAGDIIPYPNETEPNPQYNPPYSGPYNPGFQRGAPATQPPTDSDSHRAVEQAEMQDSEDSDGISSDGISTGANSGGAMERISPEDLPGLIRARSEQPMGGSSSSGSAPGAPYASRSQAYPSTLSGEEAPGRNGNLQDETSPALRASFDAREGRIWPLTLSRPVHAALHHRVNPYADVPSLYDLYSQYASRSPELVRFGNEVFRNGSGNPDQLPMDLPVGLDYVLGPGDGVNINLSGGVSERLRRVVDREGRIALPESGAVEVSGQNLGDVQRRLQTVLRGQFRDVEVEVSLARLRTVRVYVVGDVERAGAYDVSSLSTPLNAVFLAGGPTSRGSLRILRHMRGNSLVEEVDVYDLLLHGIRSGVERLQAGDTVLVPPLGAEVTVEGMVRRPARYELHGETNLAEVLELAGGVLTSGTLRHVDVERVQAHQSRTMLRLDIPENNNQESVAKALEDFAVEDGDKIKISPILPYADQTVYLEGHVFRPGKYAYRDGMVITDLIKSYGDLLPEPAELHAEIVRLNPPDYSPRVIAFNLAEALDTKQPALELKPFDTVRIFSRFDFEDPPVITVAGEVRDPGDHLTNGRTRVRDAVYLAGGLTANASTDSVQIFRRTGDNRLAVLSVNLKRALAGDDKDNVPLESEDRLIIQRNLAKSDPATVTIEGEVGRPGKYPLGQDMTAAQLVRVAGGFRRGAFTDTADLTRYTIASGQGVVGEHDTVQIARALAGEPDTDVRLHDGDVLTVRQLGGWKDVGASITVTGEVLHPGTYGIEEGERLSSILERAGGLRGDAYPYGAIFERLQVRLTAEHNRAEMLRSVENEGPALKAAPGNDANEKAAKEAALMQWQSTMERLQGTPPAGRMVIHISRDARRWRNTSADIPVRAGDSIYIPKISTSVMVDGAVYNPTAVAYKPGKSAGWYLSQAGGPSNTAYKKGIFVIRADGSVAGGAGGLFRGGAETAELRPGDMVVVPEKALSANTRWKSILEGSQVAYAVGIAIQVARTF
jgi:protein involved in polysaccharide export with SLBB domain